MEFPRNNLIRMVVPRIELRDDGAGGPVMEGHFAVFNQSTLIHGWDEDFTEDIAPGAFTKTFRENRDSIRVTLNHGTDPQLGDKPLGPIETLREDDRGAFYRVPLLDAPYVREDVLPGLRAGLYGASFRFQVVKHAVDDSGETPHRRILEARVFEFGPVTFPAYEAATAGVRSMVRMESLDLSERAELVRLMRKAQGSAVAGEATTADAEPAGATPIHDRLTELERKRAGWGT